MPAVAEQIKTFISVSEIWVPNGDQLELAAGNYGTLSDFEEASRQTSFSKGEGLPGKAWAEARPVVLKEFDGSYFKRTEEARTAGLTSAVAVPVFDGEVLKAVLVVLCADDEERMGAVEVWAENNGMLILEDGYYGAAKHFEWVSQHTHFPRGQGLPGGVWASETPMLMRDLGSGYRFVRADSAGRAGLTNGIGIPVPTPSETTYVLTLLSARGTPIANRFEIWDARSAKVGASKGAVMLDGICTREGALWDDENPRRAEAFKGIIGRVLANGLPAIASKSAETAGYDSVVVLPIHKGGELSHIVAWYC